MIAMQVPPFGLERYFASHEFSSPHLLGVSDCESMEIADLLALDPGAGDELKRLWLGYTESAGSPALRRQICGLYEELSPDEVIVHAAGVEAIFTFMNAMLSAGDHVILHYPCYQTLHTLPVGLGCDVSLWRARAEQGWKLDVDELRDLLKHDTRLIIVNSPHNPTGFHFSEEEWRELFEIADSCGALVFADEAYRGAEYQVEDRLPAGCDLYPRACSLGLLSKGYGLPGLRSAWLASRDPEVLEGVARFKDYTTICSSAPSEFLAEVGLRHGEKLLARNRRTMTDNLTALEEFFSAHGDLFQWTPPRAGPITFPTLLSGSPEEFCARVLDEAGVLLVPGTLFDPASRELRFGFGRHSFPAALEALDDSL